MTLDTDTGAFMARRRSTTTGSDDAVAKEFAKRLQHYAAEKGWNQPDLAREATKHLPKGTVIRRDNVSLYIRGLQIPGPVRLRALSKALGVQDHDLLPDQATSSANAPPLSMKPLEGGNVWLQINQAVPMELAMDIVAMLRSRGGK